MSGRKENVRNKQRQREAGKRDTVKAGSGQKVFNAVKEENKELNDRASRNKLFNNKGASNSTLNKKSLDFKTPDNKKLEKTKSDNQVSKSKTSNNRLSNNKKSHNKVLKNEYMSSKEMRDNSFNDSSVKNQYAGITERENGTAQKKVIGRKTGSKEYRGAIQNFGTKYPVKGNGKKIHANPKDNKYSKGKACPVMHKCGGCRYLYLSYEQQLERKEEIIKEYCGSFAEFEPIIGMEEPYYYRNKVHSVFGEDRKHNIISGNYEEKTHRIVSSDGCILENRQANAIIISIQKLMKSFKIRPYNEDTGYGLLRHVLIRTGHVSGQVMVVLVLASPILPSKNNFIKALLKLHPEISTIVININNRGTSMVLGDKENVIYGKGYIEDTLCGKSFRISPKSFYQVNPVQTEKLYSKAMEFAGLTGSETVLDAYCGTGTIGMIAADQANKVIGVELNGDAVKDARINAKQNKIRNIEFYQKDAGQFMVQLAEQNIKIDVVFMDPPRSGSDKVFLEALTKLQPKRIVYISCNPETMGRDLEILRKKGYRGVKGVGVDMFPWTGHCECVCLMTRKEK